MNKEDLIQKLRGKIGSPSESEIDSNTLGSAIDSAVWEYSKYKPKKVYASFDTEKDVAEVSLLEKIGSSVIEVFDCCWDPIGSYSDTDLYALPEYGEVSLSGINVFHNPSIVVQIQQKFEAFKQHFGGDWDFFDGTLRLIPAPTVSGKKVGVIAACEKPLSEIPARDEDVLLLWAEGEAEGILASKRTRISSVSMEGASINYDADGARKVAEDKKKEFRKKLGGHLGVFRAG